MAPCGNILVIYLRKKQLYRQEVPERRSGVQKVAERCSGAFQLSLLVTSSSSSSSSAVSVVVVIVV